MVSLELNAVRFVTFEMQKTFGSQMNAKHPQ